MFGADFEYWLRQDIGTVPERESIREMVNRLQEFRNEDIQEEYAGVTCRSLEFDPEGEFSGLGVPVIRLDIEDSSLLDSIEEDLEGLDGNPNGAVMHSYNAGRGILRGVENTLDELGSRGIDQVYMEVVDGTGASPVYEDGLPSEVLRSAKETVHGYGSDAAKPFAMGLLAAYTEREM